MNNYLILRKKIWRSCLRIKFSLPWFKTDFQDLTPINLIVSQKIKKVCPYNFMSKKPLPFHKKNGGKFLLAEVEINLGKIRNQKGGELKKINSTLNFVSIFFNS